METVKWISDPAHSSIRFEVTHLMIATLTGYFTEFSSNFEADENFENSKFLCEITVNSITTNDEKRDAHLKSPDFFETEKFPKIRFESTDFIKIGDKNYNLNGNLTIREISKPIILTVKYGGTILDNYGNTKSGFQLTGKISRKDFGLTWNAIIEAGGVMVSDEVKIIVNIEYKKVA